MRARVAPWEMTMMSEPSQVRAGTGRVIEKQKRGSDLVFQHPGKCCNTRSDPRIDVGCRLPLPLSEGDEVGLAVAPDQEEHRLARRCTLQLTLDLAHVRNLLLVHLDDHVV